MHSDTARGRLLSMQKFVIRKTLEQKGYTWKESPDGQIKLWIRFNNNGTSTTTEKGRIIQLAPRET